MPVSDEDVAKEQDRVEKLRAKVQDEEARANTVLRESHNDLVMAQLASEEAALQRRMDSAKETIKRQRSVAKDSIKQEVAQARGEDTVEPQPDGEPTLPTGEKPPTGKE